MSEEPAEIRSQMDQTRSELSDKLESLEDCMTEGMQTTGAAVTDTITGVRDVVQCVRESLNLPLQVQRHPWLAVSGSIALGYLAARLSEGTGATAEKSMATAAAFTPPLPEAIKPARTSTEQVLPTLRGFALGLLVGVIHDVARRGVSVVLDSVFIPAASPRVQLPVARVNAVTQTGSRTARGGPLQESGRF